ncbi:MAG: A/G-specific adenine glycosylase [Planctomycetota bacterium]|nr:MAG: A/G-specific adenine glycosylase [Planctomycetota bacterium]
MANAALCQLSYAPGDGSVRIDSSANKQEPIAAWTAAETALVRRSLPVWFRRFARDLPWKETRDPYRIWISEIMLQQTTVASVKPYFERFLNRFPTVESLALASEEEVLRLWEGLGYYSRGRNVRLAARMIVDEFGGVWPRTPDQLQRLPGVGRYVAGAVASFAFDMRAPIVEANTLRVYCRLLGFTGDPRNSRGQALLWGFAETLLPLSAAGPFNQALMDLGATVCTVQSPACPRCPLLTVCRSAALGNQDQIPQKAKRPKITDVTELTVAVLHANRVLLRQRGPDERWAGMWDFPRFACEASPTPLDSPAFARLIRSQLMAAYGLTVRDLEQILEIKHAVTRYRIRLHGFRGTWVSTSTTRQKTLPADHEWIPLERLIDRPLSVTARKLASLLSPCAPDAG